MTQYVKQYVAQDVSRYGTQYVKQYVTQYVTQYETQYVTQYVLHNKNQQGLVGSDLSYIGAHVNAALLSCPEIDINVVKLITFCFRLTRIQSSETRWAM